MSSAGLSNVGHGAFYSDGDQRTAPRSEVNERSKYEEGQQKSHGTIDSSTLFSSHCISVCGVVVMLTRTEDDRSIANRLAAQANSSDPHHPSVARGYDPEAEISKRNPEGPVCSVLSHFARQCVC